MIPSQHFGTTASFTACKCPATIGMTALVRRIAREWKETGTYSTMLADTLSYAEVNSMFE